VAIEGPTTPRSRCRSTREITALCDLFDDRIEAGIVSIKADRPTIYKDFEKMLAAPDLDA